jgi:hypothetical protein
LRVAVPTITSLDPVIGPSAGRSQIQIFGSNFRLPTAAPAPPTGAVVPEAPPSVEVLFGTEPALSVQVIDAGVIRAVTPIHDVGAFDVTVRNIDDAGVLIPGETVTEIDGYAFARPKLTAEFPSDLQRLVRTVIRELKRQVIEEVNLTVHTDFDEATGASLALAKLAKIPALILAGPELSENRFFSLNAKQDTDAIVADSGPPDGHEFVTTRAPYTVDLTFTIVGVTNLQAELLNLMTATTMFFESNKFLLMDRDGSDPSKGRVEYEMDLTTDGDLRASGDPNNSNIRTFVGSFEIRGFDIQQVFGMDSGMIEGVPKHEIVDRGRTADDEPTISTEPVA